MALATHATIDAQGVCARMALRHPVHVLKRLAHTTVTALARGAQFGAFAGAAAATDARAAGRSTALADGCDAGAVGAAADAACAPPLTLAAALRALCERYTERDPADDVALGKPRRAALRACAKDGAAARAAH
jgi:hypothetical protein